MADGKVVFDIEGNPSKIDSTIKGVTATIREESKKWDSDTSGAFNKVEEASRSTSGVMSSVFSGAFMAVTTTVISATGQILKAFGDWAIAAIDVASDLEEVQNVVDVTFGEAGAKKIDKWAKNAGTQFGLTELQAKKFTSTLGAMMKSSGMTGDEIVDISTDLAGLAADMASFYNLDFETAFQKIRSGISGETEPLKQLGINMSVGNLDAYLESIGSEKSFQDLSQTEQLLTRYQYLLQATADAQGDFARTSVDSYANINRQIETQTATLQAKVGEDALPFVKNMRKQWLDFLRLLNGDNGVTVMGNESQLRTWIDEQTEAAAKAREEFDQLADTYAWIVDMDRETFESEPGFYDSYGEFILQTMRGQQMFSGGLQRERLDEAIPKLEAALSKAQDAEAKTADYQNQLDSLMSSAEDTTENGAAAVDNFASGMQREQGKIAAQVAAINSILGTLGVKLKFGGLNIPLIDGSHAAGLDNVPFDGYLAELHAGEGILNAQENRIWQWMKHGGADNGVDYEMLGGLMRDNVKTGGNVYLDGRTVGQVISDQQGKLYRQLQRSGWQG